MVNGVPKVHESTDSPAMQIDNITYENHCKITLVKYHNFNDGKRKILQKRTHNQVNKISHPVVIQEKIAQPVLFLETRKKINTSD